MGRKTWGVAPMPHSPGPFTSRPAWSNEASIFILVDANGHDFARIRGEQDTRWMLDALNKQHQIEVNIKRNNAALYGEK